MNNKTISIDKDLFKFSSDRKSRKRNPSKQTSEIKVREPVKEKDKQRKIRKQHVLRFIRDQQERNYRKILGGDPNIRDENKLASSAPPDKFSSDFDESLKYLMTLTDTPEPKHRSPTVNHNYTLKQPNVSAPKSDEMAPFIHTGSFDDRMNGAVTIYPPRQENAFPPKWGCMKNGSLPTYRNWKNVTQKKPTSYDQTPSAMIHMPSVDSRSSGSIRPTITNEPIKPFQISPSATDRFTSSRPIDDRKQEMRALAMAVSASSDTYNPPNRYLKQRRTVRRKYALGKSKTQPKISVLISNRTIRNNIMTKTQAFKQVHIDEIKRFLVKKGFIRVGSSAPNDVLRKMYETASLMCGEIDNHNPDNLLYNYLHNTNESNA
jgi:hypothetical protein